MSDEQRSSAITKALTYLAIIGAVNWGLIGFFNFNLVDAIFGGGTAEETSSASRVVYALVGVAGLVAAVLLPKLHGTTTRSMRDRPILQGR